MSDPVSVHLERSLFKHVCAAATCLLILSRKNSGASVLLETANTLQAGVLLFSLLECAVHFFIEGFHFCIVWPSTEKP